MNGLLVNPTAAITAGVSQTGLLYHMARPYHDGTTAFTPGQSLDSMIQSQFIQGQPNKGYFARLAKVRSVSFSGSSIDRLSKLVSRRSEFGICFQKNMIDPLGTEIKPVHYLGRGAIDMIRYEGVYPTGLGRSDRNWIDLEEEGTYSFSWEEEWRLMGDLMFDRDSVAFLIVPTLEIGARFYALGYHSILSSAIRDPKPHMERLAWLIMDARRRTVEGEKVDEVSIQDSYLVWLAYRFSEVYDDFYPKIRAEMRRDEEREIYNDWGELRDPDGEGNLFEAAMFDLDNMVDSLYEDND